MPILGNLRSPPGHEISNSGNKRFVNRFLKSHRTLHSHATLSPRSAAKFLKLVRPSGYCRHNQIPHSKRSTSAKIKFLFPFRFQSKQRPFKYTEITCCFLILRWCAYLSVLRITSALKPMRFALDKVTLGQAYLPEFFNFSFSISSHHCSVLIFHPHVAPTGMTNG